MAYLLLILMAIWILGLQNRVNELEERLGIRKKTPTTPNQEQAAHTKQKETSFVVPEKSVEGAPTWATHTGQQPAVTPASGDSPLKTHSTPQETSPSFDLFAWLKTNFLIKFGALLLFLGVGWFVSYAFSQGWVSPGMRIFLGLLLAVSIYALSVWRIKIERTQGIVLNALGTGIVLAVVSAAQFVYFMFPPLVALMLMVGAVSYTTFFGMRYRHELLLIAAAISGLIAPLLTNETEPDMTSFFSYLLVYAVAFVFVSARMGWGSVALTLLVGVGLYEFAYFVSDEITHTLIFLIFVFLFGTLFYVASLVGTLIKGKIASEDLYIGGFNSLILLYWILELVSESFQSTVAFVISIVAAATAYTLYQHQSSRRHVYLHAGIAGVFLVAATAFEFSGETLVMMYVLESTLVLSVAMFLGFSQRFIHFSSLIFLLAILLSLDSFFAPEWEAHWLHPDAYALYSVCIAAGILSIISWSRKYHETFSLFLAACSLYGVVLVWLVTHALFSDADAFALSTIIYALLSMLALVTTCAVRAKEEGVYAAAFTNVLPGVMVIQLLLNSSVWKDSWLHIETAAILIFIGLLLWSGYWLHILGKKEVKQYYHTLKKVFAITAGILFGIYIWRIAHVMFKEDVAVTVSLFVYVVFGLALYLFGRARDISEVRIAAGCILGFVVLRLLIVDVWQMEILWRVVTFAGIGALFIATSFLERPRLLGRKNEALE